MSRAFSTSQPWFHAKIGYERVARSHRPADRTRTSLFFLIGRAGHFLFLVVLLIGQHRLFVLLVRLIGRRRFTALVLFIGLYEIFKFL